MSRLNDMVRQILIKENEMWNTKPEVAMALMAALGAQKNNILIELPKLKEAKPIKTVDKYASDTAQQKRDRKNAKRLAGYMPAGFARLKDPRCGDGGEACTHCLIIGKCFVPN